MRPLSVLALVVAACGGSQKSTTPPPPLPTEAKAEPATPPEPKPEAKPTVPAEPPPGPHEVPIASPAVSVKLVSPGKGKRAPLKMTPKQGGKQTIELALDFAGKQAGPPEAGGTQEDVAPTLVLTGDAEVKSVDDKGAAQFELHVSKLDTRDQPGQQMAKDDVEKLLTLLKDLKLAGTVSANGAASDMKLRLDMAPAVADKALALLGAEVLPVWPILPAEPVGVGAKWTVTATTKLADKLDVTQTTEYEPGDHK